MIDWQRARTLLGQMGWPVSGGSSGDLSEAVSDFQRGFAFALLSVDGVPGDLTISAMEHSVGEGGRCSPNFLFREFKSNGNGWIKVHRDLVRGLEAVRLLSAQPIRIASAYRDPAYNLFVGGATNSVHQTGGAVDSPDLPNLAEVMALGIFSGIGALLPEVDPDARVSHVDVRGADQTITNRSGGTPSDPTLWGYNRRHAFVAADRSWSRLPRGGPGLPPLQTWKPADAFVDDEKRDVTRLVNAGSVLVEAAVAAAGGLGFTHPGVEPAVEGILAAAASEGMTMPQAAYALSTAARESGLGKHARETGTPSYFARYEAGTRLGTVLGNTEPGDGHFFRGAGHVQITGRNNFTIWQRRLVDAGHRVNIVNNPDQAAEPAVSAFILCHGLMRYGWTGSGTLPQHVGGAKVDFLNARRVVNGLDHAEEIAASAERFWSALDAVATEPLAPSWADALDVSPPRPDRSGEIGELRARVVILESRMDAMVNEGRRG